MLSSWCVFSQGAKYSTFNVEQEQVRASFVEGHDFSFSLLVEYFWALLSMKDIQAAVDCKRMASAPSSIAQSMPEAFRRNLIFDAWFWSLTKFP